MAEKKSRSERLVDMADKRLSKLENEANEIQIELLEALGMIKTYGIYISQREGISQSQLLALTPMLLDFTEEVNALKGELRPILSKIVKTENWINTSKNFTDK